MDIKETGKKIKPFAPVLSVALVTACVAGSLSGYQAPVYAAQEVSKSIKEDTQEEEKKQSALLNWKMECIKEPERVLQEILQFPYRLKISRSCPLI